MTTHRLHVLFISHKYPPSTGGMEKFSYELIKGFETASVPTIKHIYDGSISKVKWFYSLRKEVRVLLDNNKQINIIHANDGLMAFFCRWIALEYNIPVVATLHGLDVVFPVKFYQTKVIPNLGKYFKSLICVSNATARAAIDRGVPSSVVTVIANGVDHDLARFESKDQSLPPILQEFDRKNKKLIVGLGRGVRRKGYGWFVKEVLPKLDDSNLFIMLGPRTFYEKYERIFAKLFPKKLKHNLELLLGLSTDDQVLAQAEKDPVLSDKYRRTGYLPFSEISTIISNADLFIMPNLKEENDMEGFGLVALEASLLGTYLLVSKVDGITDAVIENGNGKLISSGNVQEWVSTLQHLLSDVSLLDKLGQKGRQYTLDNYSWDKMTKEYINHFIAVIKDYENGNQNN